VVRELRRERQRADAREEAAGGAEVDSGDREPGGGAFEHGPAQR
jgi:hypothetical protein